MIRLIDTALLDEVCREAAASPRRRKNRNFHPHDEYPAHRLLNAMEPGSYIRPHRHLGAEKDETMVVLRGRLGLVMFEDDGRVAQTVVLGQGGDAVGVDIPHGAWHTVFALEPDTVLLEAKAGPYCPLTADETAPWAPGEGTQPAAAFLAELLRLFR
jgi:cupin fold WbuC family metalloprotein